MASIVICRQNGGLYTVTFDIQQAAERIALCYPPAPSSPRIRPLLTSFCLLSLLLIVLLSVCTFLPPPSSLILFFFFGNQAGVGCPLTFVLSTPCRFLRFLLSPFCMCTINDICCPLFECLSHTHTHTHRTHTHTHIGTHKSKIDNFSVLCYPENTMTHRY